MLKLTLCKKDTYFRHILGHPVNANLIQSWYYISGLMIGTIFFPYKLLKKVTVRPISDPEK
jgi:hypothetical protein